MRLKMFTIADLFLGNNLRSIVNVEKKINQSEVSSFVSLILSYLSTKCFDETASLFKRKIPRVRRCSLRH